ncbi:unnamed protein product (macronuclear) [Paramecium tetraurelia]|uniref:WWE domain-containing protein n=1 Tax=Paramecium tetraurelia TaxID=5888 RepID=A0BBN8_PARTE|nr:uncharacterized protein GSPATT00000390001 [Paramecium tetraurelia]CAK55955.1 unnamed protein product [Paramecium tetraurelia]|eukprot:XP_001423353.1 hypothetical protein (macronuclear) [Paramecium tetraurelia strain d4-2]
MHKIYLTLQKNKIDDFFIIFDSIYVQIQNTKFYNHLNKICIIRIQNFYYQNQKLWKNQNIHNYYLKSMIKINSINMRKFKIIKVLDFLMNRLTLFIYWIKMEDGCYYDSQGQPSGWIALSKDGKKYMKFNMNSDLLIESSNIYYSNHTFDAAHSEQYQQLYQSNNKKQLKENQQPEVQCRKQQDQENKNQQQNLKGYKDKQKVTENQNDKMDNATENVKEQQQTKNQLQEKGEKFENEIQQFRNRGNKEQKNIKNSKNNKNNKNIKNNKNSNRDNQNSKNNETQKYYSLDIQENTLSNEDFVKQLIEVYKIKKDCIIEFNEKILKLVSEKDAVKLYRANKKEQNDKVQKFIVSI